MSASQVQTIYADAVLFDMDGTLTDSISAVEAAWGKVAVDIGQDPAMVIAATHGKRGCDNLKQFKPEIQSHEMDAEVQAFEETILFFADAYNVHGPGSQPTTPATYAAPQFTDSGSATPDLSAGSSLASSRASSFSATNSRRPSFASRLSNMLSMSAVPEYESAFEDPIMEDVHSEIIGHESAKDKVVRHQLEAWQQEATAVDRSVKILPGVKRMMDSIPAGRYAVATSGAKTYAYGCMTRVGITPPPVTITADDKRLANGKPFPDPFLLAAKELGFDCKRTIVFEDSPSGIRAGVASGATVIAVCTSHERSKIENCGAHYIVEDMSKVHCFPEGDRLRFTVEL
ncbi:HAD-like protein [Athelia psychrophila]|uniref:HAD-like protein n=1 Tax=Athelia psychrophila TaxID=1759441 RepID=A0A166HJW2_9AGAM|nr:HAD-like protein [Fibularhizoctonia sp. CBS 109695]